MGPVARMGVVCLMLLAVGLARLIEVQLDPGPVTPELRLAPSPAGATPTSAERGTSPERGTRPASTPRPESAPATPAAAAPAHEEPGVPRTYVVKPGDTLGGIARKVYGTSRGWERILEANKRVIPSPTKIRAGVELVIPPPTPPASSAPQRRIPGTRGA